MGEAIKTQFFGKHSAVSYQLSARRRKEELKVRHEKDDQLYVSILLLSCIFLRSMTNGIALELTAIVLNAYGKSTTIIIIY